MNKIKRYLSVSERYFSGVNNLLVLGTALIIVSVMFCTVYNVIMSNVFDEPKSWVFELSAYSTLYIVFLPLAYAQQEGSHIKVDIISRRLPYRWVKIANVAVSIISLFYFVIITWGAAHYCDVYYERRSGGGIDIWLFPVIVVMPIGAFLISLQLFIDLIKRITVLIPQGKESG